jgi:hypothetical protein
MLTVSFASANEVGQVNVVTLRFPTDFAPYDQFINSQQAGTEAAAMNLWGSLTVTHPSQKAAASRAMSVLIALPLIADKGTSLRSAPLSSSAPLRDYP